MLIKCISGCLMLPLNVTSTLLDLQLPISVNLLCGTTDV